MLERIVHRNGAVGYVSRELARLGVPHLFTTRVGPNGRTLDVGRLDDELLTVVRELGGLPRARLVDLKQVHGALVHEIADAPLAPRTEGDALTSGRCDRVLLVYTADCVPVLVAGAGGRRVAAIHAGWRGILAGVVPATLERLGARPEVAAIGPCLSLASCEMGPEVAEQFVAAGLGEAVHHGLGEKPHVDLRAAVRWQLACAGVGAVEVSSHCTYLDEAEFPSHRRDVTHGGGSRAGRIGALIAARP